MISQGLFYLDWLVDHKAEFQRLVMKTLGAEAGPDIDWNNPRVICVASGFTRYDEHAVDQMGRSIELVRYQDFEGELLAWPAPRRSAWRYADRVRTRAWPRRVRRRTPLRCVLARARHPCRRAKRRSLRRGSGRQSEC